MAGNEQGGTHLRIKVTTRLSKYDPFGEPRTLDAVSGFVEAPTLPANANELFYHRRIGARFHIYRV